MLGGVFFNLILVPLKKEEEKKLLTLFSLF